MIDVTAAWHRHRDAVLRLLRRRVDVTAADDLLQETFLRLHRARPALPDDGAVRAWLLHAARNLLVDHYRAERRTDAVPDDLAAATPTLPAPIDTLQACIAPLTARLPAAYREALALDLAGLSQQAIAKRNGISLSGAKSRVQRARQMLRTEFEHCCQFRYDADGSLLDYREREAALPCTP